MLSERIKQIPLPVFILSSGKHHSKHLKMRSIQKDLFQEGGWGTEILRNFLNFKDRAISMPPLNSELKTLKCQQCGMEAPATAAHFSPLKF